ncbi:glutamine amidotransferase [Alkalilimnicola ehrlichii MLHE-1]|uniref:Glutamine amidotransferase class-I n=1 Tax=Alkalilimnicola ehrlichii (strain ATCC BAA-1101 / DSM 17681 / MLHE-1) TaxID=187272 RepID=Q0A884_ALKEH|nr:glutamine amidotransferase [Alkalilimnicola ehrlichii]ABI56953.1 glutamine amidotransferase class-I [Alkalilimnicola ehrlichii MLHE-1]
MDDNLDKPLIILKAGSTFPALAEDEGNFEDWIRHGLGELELPVRVVDPRAQAGLPEPTRLAGVIITGSHGMVTEGEPWLPTAEQWLRALVAGEVPVLGICYGHQLLARAMGGAVDYRERGIEIGTATVHRTEPARADPLFRTLPQAFPAQVVHRQFVRHLPRGAVVLARSGVEPHHAFRIGARAWGVQFHPEFSPEVMRRYIEFVTPQLQMEDQDPDRLLHEVRATPAASRLLPRFGALAAAWALCGERRQANPAASA